MVRTAIRAVGEALACLIDLVQAIAGIGLVATLGAWMALGILELVPVAFGKHFFFPAEPDNALQVAAVPLVIGGFIAIISTGRLVRKWWPDGWHICGLEFAIMPFAAVGSMMSGQSNAGTELGFYRTVIIPEMLARRRSKP